MGAMSTPQTIEHYDEMLRLAEHQAELIDRGELTALEPVAERWQELEAAMPEQPPAAAAALLQRVAALTKRSETHLLRMQRALMQDVAVAAKASRAAHSYALQRQRVRRIDHCA
jgi:hypothetical protein